VDVPDVSPNGKIDRACLQLLRRRRPADTARVLLTGVLGDGPLLLDGAPGKQSGHALGERGEILGIARLTPFSCPLSSESTSLGIRQAFLFGPRERVIFDQHTLSLVALAGTAKAHDNGAQRRVAAGSAGQRDISTLKKHQVIEIGASETERPFPIDAKKASLPKLFTALGTS
jgi:hypothetical protein